MLYPAELRAAVRSLIRTGKNPSRSGSEAGVSAAVLADIGGGALIAFHGGRAIVIGEGSGHGAGAVIVQIADRVGQRVGAEVAVMMAGFGQAGGSDNGREQAGGDEKLQFLHHDTPITPGKTGLLGRSGPHFTQIAPGKCGKMATAAIFPLVWDA